MTISSKSIPHAVLSRAFFAAVSLPSRIAPSEAVNGTWTNTGYTVYETNVTGGARDVVTNFTDTVDSQNFIRLKTEQGNANKIT